jgi:hypothetical protein
MLRLIVPRTTTGKRDAKSKPTQQHKHQHPNSAGVYRLPGQYCQNRQSGERHEFALPAFKPHAGAFQALPQIPSFWCTGEDSNLRSSKERQIYSLLPLTTRPPVHYLRFAHAFLSALSAIHSTYVLAFEHPTLTRFGHPSAFRSQRPRQNHDSLPEGFLCGGSAGHLLTPVLPWRIWSWRRDLNPRPPDYKSGALPAELRQPKTARTILTPDTRGASAVRGVQNRILARHAEPRNGAPPGSRSVFPTGPGTQPKQSATPSYPPGFSPPSGRG